jgi:hypothetical protein
MVIKQSHGGGAREAHQATVTVMAPAESEAMAENTETSRSRILPGVDPSRSVTVQVADAPVATLVTVMVVPKAIEGLAHWPERQ